jgi:hypothetical protein
MKSYYTQDKKTAFDVETTNKARTEACNKILESYTNTKSLAKGKTASENIVAVAKIIENMKATSIETRDIARTVLCYE